MNNLDLEITTIKNVKKEVSLWDQREQGMTLHLLQVPVHIMNQVKI